MGADARLGSARGLMRRRGAQQRAREELWRVQRAEEQGQAAAATDDGIRASSDASPARETTTARHRRPHTSPPCVGSRRTRRRRGILRDVPERDYSNSVMYCDCADVLSHCVDPVDFHFFALPSAPMALPLGRESVAEVRAFRTMGCVGGSIKFVSIDGFITRNERRDMRDRNVTIWTLEENLEWTVEDRLSMDDLWNMPGFYSNLANIQRLFANPYSLAPMYPFLSTKEDHVIYFALGQFDQGQSLGSFPTTLHFLLRVDMSLWDVSYIHIPESDTPVMQNYFGVNHSILCPPVALPPVAPSRDVKAKLPGLQAKMKGLMV